MRLLVCLLFLLPLATAMPVLEDPAGDVEMSSYGTSNDAVGNWQAVDLLGLDIEEEPRDLLFTVDIEGLPDCAEGQCVNAGDLRTYFQYGELAYYVQQGIDPLGNAYGVLNAVEPGGVDGQPISQRLGAVLNIDESSVTVRVPRDLIVDESGTPPIKDRSITHLVTRSYSQFSLGGPDLTGTGETDMLVTRDRMGFEAPASFTFTTGGGSNNGPLVASSTAPFRASNGGAAVYRYDIDVHYAGDAETALDLELDGLPVGWEFSRPNGTLTMAPDTSRTFGILIETPSGHQHGGTDTFDLVITDASDADTWARVELGVHYLTTPQPAGHHPTLYLHTLTDGTVAQAAATFGGDDGRIWMNTLEEDPGDENVGVVAQEGFGGFQAQTSVWSVCMIPNLRLGLDFDIERTGLLDVTIGATAPHNGVTITGELLHVAGPEPLDFCAPQLYRNRDTTVLATLGDSDVKDLLGTASDFELIVTPTPESDLVPYEEGAQLVLELTATFTGGDPSHDGLKLYEGRLDLPLLEYRDERPAGYVGGVADELNTTLGALDEPVVNEKESPAGWLLLPVLLGVLLRRR